MIHHPAVQPLSARPSLARPAARALSWTPCSALHATSYCPATHATSSMSKARNTGEQQASFPHALRLRRTGSLHASAPPATCACSSSVAANARAWDTNERLHRCLPFPPAGRLRHS
eukprot:2369546-Lingulodinium_polyedra.AAC.1